MMSSGLMEPPFSKGNQQVLFNSDIFSSAWSNLACRDQNQLPMTLRLRLVERPFNGCLATPGWYPLILLLTQFLTFAKLD